MEWIQDFLDPLHEYPTDILPPPDFSSSRGVAFQICKAPDIFGVSENDMVLQMPDATTEAKSNHEARNLSGADPETDHHSGDTETAAELTSRNSSEPVASKEKESKKALEAQTWNDNVMDTPAQEKQKDNVLHPEPVTPENSPGESVNTFLDLSASEDTNHSSATAFHPDFELQIHRSLADSSVDGQAQNFGHANADKEKALEKPEQLGEIHECVLQVTHDLTDEITVDPFPEAVENLDKFETANDFQSSHFAETVIDQVYELLEDQLGASASTENRSPEPTTNTATNQETDQTDRNKEQLNIDALYNSLIVDGEPNLPSLATYKATFGETAQFPTHAVKQPPPFPPPHPKIAKRSSKKKQVSKREAGRATSAVEVAREKEIALLASTKQITDEELLRLKPKKQRRAARFDKPVPSRFCHICSRTPKNVRLVVCCKIKEGTCRKVICEKCFEEYKYGDFNAALQTQSSNWTCPHCAGRCPDRAQCRTYQRINDRLRANRLKQDKPTGKSGKRGRRSSGEGENAQQSEDGGPEIKRPRFLLPAIAPLGENVAAHIPPLVGEEKSNTPQTTAVMESPKQQTGKPVARFAPLSPATPASSRPNSPTPVNSFVTSTPTPMTSTSSPAHFSMPLTNVPHQTSMPMMTSFSPTGVLLLTDIGEDSVPLMTELPLAGNFHVLPAGTEAVGGQANMPGVHGLAQEGLGMAGVGDSLVEELLTGGPKEGSLGSESHRN